ncbi:hypothetical protein LTR15_010194 [Elasticomyces elasticus]|nr:hypothetical protein LTR15_010194 [Elasticomyces elasticus]
MARKVTARSNSKKEETSVAEDRDIEPKSDDAYKPDDADQAPVKTKGKRKAKRSVKSKRKRNAEPESSEAESTDMDQDGLEEEITESERKRRLYVPHLLPFPREKWGQIKVDSHDPGAAKAIQFGNVGQQWNGSRSEYEDGLARLKASLIHGLETNKAAVLAAPADQELFFPGSKRAFEAISVEDEVDTFIAGMSPNTIAALGRKVFRLSDLDDMASLTVEDTYGWLLYFGVIVHKSGAIEVYGGAASAQEGSGRRLLGDYEFGLQWARLGYAPSVVSGNTFLRAAAQPNVVAVYLRPVTIFKNGKTSSTLISSFTMHIREGMTVDYIQGIKPIEQMGSEITMFNNQKIVNVLEMFSLTKAAAPIDRVQEWKGLNGVSPYYQISYYNSGIAPFWLSEKGKLWLIDMELHGCECPICDHDMTVPQRLSGSRSMYRIANPLKGFVPGLDREVICLKCGHWLQWNDNPTLIKARALPDVEAVRAFRRDTVRSTENLMKRRTEPECGSACPFCETNYCFVREFQGKIEARQLFAKRVGGRNPYDVPSNIAHWAWLQDIDYLCFRCAGWFSNLLHRCVSEKRVEIEVRRCNRIARAQTMEEVKGIVPWVAVKRPDLEVANSSDVEEDLEMT